jgi:hypothetical protein
MSDIKLREYLPGRKWSKKKELRKRQPEKPYVIETELEKLKLSCLLCQDPEVKCCPEHCCDVSLLVFILTRISGIQGVAATAL